MVLRYCLDHPNDRSADRGHRRFRRRGYLVMRWCAVSIKSFIVVVLFIVVLAGATGGDASVKNVGDAIGTGVHWIAVAWTAIVGQN